MKWEKLFIDQIQIQGIHLDLLKKQGDGLSKHIGEVFEDLSDNSAWLGGTGEAWERGPYYIDGLIPLAYLLNDEQLLQASHKWITSILTSQDETGFFGPSKNNDFWPRAVVLKAMVSAYLATKDEKILSFTNKYLHYVSDHIDEHPFDFWGFSRGMEGIEIHDILMKKNTSVKLVDLEQKLKNNTLDWASYFNKFPYPEKTDKYMNKLLFRIVKYVTGILDDIKKRRTKPPKINKHNILKSRTSHHNLIFLKTHGVNIAMALKYLLYWGNSSDDMFKALDTVLKYHGNASGIFSSDEHLNGISPESGIELCNVVEMMYTMEEAIRLTGSMEAADRLEFYAYNALLTTITSDFTAHQYVQQVNQLDCEVKPHPFYDAYRYANTFGVEPNYGCCAANMHQGWPKMMLSAVMKSDYHLGIFMYMSGVYKVVYPNGHVVIEIKTSYPFNHTVSIKCLASTVDDIKWQLRIPFKAQTILIKGDKELVFKHKDSYVLEGLKKGEKITLTFDFDVKTIHNEDGTVSVKRGPLLYAQHLNYDEFYIKGKKPFYDRGFSPKSQKNIALMVKDDAVIVHDIKKKDSQSFFGNDSYIIVKGYDLDTNAYTDVKLHPYGLSVLRRTHFTKKYL